MKGILRNTIFNSFALFLLPLVISGASISGGAKTLLIAGFVLTLLFLVLKPILSLFTLPIQALTLGLFSFLINVLLLYILTILIPQIKISPFVMYSFPAFFITVPRVAFNGFFAYIVSSFFISVVTLLLDWVCTEDE